jgi:formate--tetrahydrofolate ligase
MKPIKEIYELLNIDQQFFLPFGQYKAKIDLKVMNTLEHKKDGKLILVTAINPTPAGEGKTTTSIGLAQGLKYIGKSSILALREPSLGPVFGLKGGATGGGLSSVVPEEDINLHFTGDLHAITAANNLLSALIDNHMFHGNQLDLKEVTWPRVMDMNDRNLRTIQTKQREDQFIITAASEVMAVLSLASDIFDLKRRLDRILIGYNSTNEPVFVSDLGAADAMTLLLKEAMNPNLVQALEGVPTLVHCGPFANIAHGCNSLVATKLGLKLADYVVTEAGFGADLGMEKFLHLKMPHLHHDVDAVVIVATLRALKLHGGATDYALPDINALKEGMKNLEKHIENIQQFNLPFVISLNHFDNDPIEETEYVLTWAKNNHYNIALSKGFKEGGKGMQDLANEVVNLCNQPSTFQPLYQPSKDIQSNIEKIATSIYGAKEVVFSKSALNDINMYQQLGWYLPICMAKTPLSLSGDAVLKGRPEGFTIEISKVRPSLGAGFLVAQTKGIMVMPGLNQTPRALRFKLHDDGEIKEVDS